MPQIRKKIENENNQRIMGIMETTTATKNYP